MVTNRITCTCTRLKKKPGEPRYPTHKLNRKCPRHKQVEVQGEPIKIKCAMCSCTAQARQFKGMLEGIPWSWTKMPADWWRLEDVKGFHCRCDKCFKKINEG